MSKAREIAEERFAKGEITEDEFNSIVNRLPSGNSSAEKPKKKNNTLKYFMYFVAGLFALNLLFSITGGGSTANLKMTNLTANARAVTFSMANTGTRERDVLAYVETQDGSTKCPHVFSMSKESTKEVTFYCDSPSGGSVSVRYMWASAGNDGLLKLARRIN